jgi:hypothetical protein
VIAEFAGEAPTEALLVELPRDDAGDQKARYHEENINADEAGEPEMADRRRPARKQKSGGSRQEQASESRFFEAPERAIRHLEKQPKNPIYSIAC